MLDLSPINIILVYFSGILSILSPCVLPLLPGILAYLAGLSLTESHLGKNRQILIKSSLMFCLGFSMIFGAFGLIALGIGKFLAPQQLLLQQISGLIIICFGILQTGLVKIPILERAFKLSAPQQHLGYLFKAWLFGVLFAFSWTPCFGPIIGGIFTLSASQKTLAEAIGLFLIYSLGLSTPILLLSLFFHQISGWIKKNRLLFKYANILAGVLLIIIGLAMFTNSFSSIVNWLNFIYTENKFTFS